MYETPRFCTDTVAAGTVSSTIGLFGDASGTSTFDHDVCWPASTYLFVYVAAILVASFLC